MFDGGLKMLLGALGVPVEAVTEAIERIPQLQAEFEGFLKQGMQALADMETRQKRIELMVSQLHAEKFGNGETGQQLAVTDRSANG